MGEWEWACHALIDEGLPVLLAPGLVLKHAAPKQPKQVHARLEGDVVETLEGDVLSLVPESTKHTQMQVRGQCRKGRTRSVYRYVFSHHLAASLAFFLVS